MAIEEGKGEREKVKEKEGRGVGYIINSFGNIHCSRIAKKS